MRVIVNMQIPRNGNATLIREVVISVECEPLANVLNELTRLIANLPFNVVNDSVANLLVKIVVCLSSRKFYTRSKSISADRASYRIVLVPSGEFCELISAFRIWACERENVALIAHVPDPLK